MTQTQSGQRWTGSYISGSHPAVVVKYAGPTDKRGSRWLATLKRDSQTTWRASACYEDGPLAAALELLNKRGLNWRLMDCASIDPDTYAVVVQ